MTPVPRARAPRRARRRSLSAAVAVGALTLAGQPLVAFAAPPTVTTPTTPVAYVEQAPPVPIGEDVALAGGSGYGGGYIDYAVSGATADEQLSLVTVATADTTAGAVSIVGTTVYVGNGTGADVIGAVDSIRTGSNGVLRINFVSPFVNPSFEDSASIDGWTVVENRVDLGVTSLGGFTSIDRSTYTGIAGGSGFAAPVDDNAAPVSASYQVRLTTSAASSGSTSLELTSDMQTAEGCDVVHGPAVFSDPFEASQNDKIYFDWRAFQGSDNFHVFGYILNVATGAQTTVLDATGGNEVNAFRTKETVIPVTGSYRFVFVGGTQDRTCGRAAGATLLIDNVRVFGTKVNDAVVTRISDKVLYANASDDPAPTRSVVITAADGTGAASTAGTVQIAITAVDDAPTFGPVPAITLTNTEGPQTYATTTGTLDVTDPDSTVTSSIVGGSAVSAVIGGVTYDRAITGTYGTLHLQSSTGRYAFVPDAAASDARTTDDEETFEFEISATDDSPGGPHPPKTLRRTLTVVLDVADTPPGSPTAASAAARAGGAQLSWSAPEWTAGTPITGYAVQQSTDGGATWNTVVADTGSTTTSLAVPDLAPGTPVAFRVAAHNANGLGVWGVPSAAVVPFTTADAPAPATATAGDTTVRLEWTTPASDGWSSLTGYRIEQSLDGGGTWTTVVADTESDETSYTVTGLANGVAAQFRISALNAAGSGPATSAGPATPRTVPGAPAGLAAAPDDGRVVLTWSAPASDGGAPISGYALEQSTDGGRSWVTVTADTGSADTTYTVTGLTNGTPTLFRVAAVNEAGSGPGATTAATPRRAAGPVVIDAVTPANGTLVVSFTPPADDGGSPVVAYEYSLDGGATWQRVSGTRSPLLITGLENGTEYDVRVRAVTDAGPGAASDIEEATPRLALATSSNGTVPVLEPGTSLSTRNGVAEQISAGPSGSTWRITGEGFTITLQALDASGAPVALSNGRLVVPAGGSIEITGEGYAPGSPIDVWLAGAGILVGETTADAEGTFAVTLALPDGAVVGPETLQVNGIAPDGAVRSVSTGLEIVAKGALAQTGGGDPVGAGLIAGGAAIALLLVGVGLTARARTRRAGLAS